MTDKTENEVRDMIMNAVSLAIKKKDMVCAHGENKFSLLFGVTSRLCDQRFVITISEDTGDG